MSLDPWNHRAAPDARRRFVAALARLILAALPAAAVLAQPTPVVPVQAEPEHRIRFDNGRVRLYVVNLAPGRGTLMHEHAADAFGIVLGSGDMTHEPLGGDAMSFTPPMGLVTFTPAPRPYAHRISAPGSRPFKVAALELLAPPRGPAPASRRGAPFTMDFENARGRVYRYTLQPQQSTGTFARAGGTAVIALATGRIAEAPEGQPPRLWDFDSGDFRWLEAGERLSLRNEGTAPVELVEIEVF